jgi:hypothetical protein
MNQQPKRYITIGDLVISKKYNIIGNVVNKLILQGRDKWYLNYRIKVDFEKTKTFFKEVKYQFLQDCKDEEIELINPMLMYNKKMTIPQFNIVKDKKKILFGAKVKIVDSYYFEKVLVNVNDQTLNIRNVLDYAYITNNFFVYKLQKNLVTLIYIYKESKSISSVVVVSPISCLVFKSRTNIINRFYLHKYISSVKDIINIEKYFLKRKLSRIKKFSYDVFYSTKKLFKF